MDVGGLVASTDTPQALRLSLLNVVIDVNYRMQT